LNRLDNRLCDRFQQLSDWLQDMTGRTCFWYAFVCFVGCLCLSALRYVRGEIGVVRFCVVAVCVLGILFLCEFLKAYFMPGSKFMNPLRSNIYLVIFRTFLACILLFVAFCALTLMFLWRYSLTLALIDISYMLLVISVYFASCTPRPGSKQRLGKFLDNLSHKLFGKFFPQRT
jgi:hypothetical protein